MYKLFKIAAIILGLIGVVFLVMVLTDNTDIIPSYLVVAYITLGISILITVLFSITQLFKNPETLKRTLISVGFFAAVILITYFTSSGEVVEKQGVEIISANGSKWVGAGLGTFYVLALLAIGLMVYSGIRKLIKS